jgi:lipid-A-disaccharide synthase
LPNCDILVIAGEASGDEHAGALIAQLKAKNPALKVAALGGRHLAAAEAHMLDDLTRHARVGLWEVLKHLGVFFKLIDETVLWIEQNRPRMVLFVDFVGYNLEVAKRLYQKKLAHKAGGAIQLYFYISPMIWAWKARRRFKIARWIDSLGTIFPFEVAYYKDTTLDAQFVGHPFVSADFKNPFSYDPNGPVVLLPGSRRAIVKQHLGVLWEGFQLYEKQSPATKALAVYSSEPIRRQMIEITDGSLPLCPSGAPVKASCVICTAGTISLTCALAGIPGIVIYKTDALTFAYGKMAYQKKYLGMPNILLNRPQRPLMQEFWQEQVTPPLIAAEIARLRADPEVVFVAKDGAEELRKLLSQPTRLNAVEWVMEGLK